MSHSASSTPSKAPFKACSNDNITSVSQLGLSPRRLSSFLSRRRRQQQATSVTATTAVAVKKLPSSTELPQSPCGSLGRNDNEESELAKTTIEGDSARLLEVADPSSIRNRDGISVNLAQESDGKVRRASACASYRDTRAQRDASGNDRETETNGSSLTVRQARSHRLASDPSARENTNDRFIQRHQSNFQQSCRMLSSSASPCCSISGVSLVSGGQSPMVHEQQSIGRSATTNTINLTGANHSALTLNNLLSSKIGVILLEGSYCERLVDSASATISKAATSEPTGLHHNCHYVTCNSGQQQRSTSKGSQEESGDKATGCKSFPTTALTVGRPSSEIECSNINSEVSLHCIPKECPW